MSFKRPSLSSLPSLLLSSVRTSKNSRAKCSLFSIFLLFIVICVSTTFITPSSLSSPYIKLLLCKIMEVLRTGCAQEEAKSRVVIKNTKKTGDRNKEAEIRRILRGLGSFPPRCSSKCGRCTPCRPVHVAVPPGTPVTAEYYPEAWRCKCGNKLYMP